MHYLRPEPLTHYRGIAMGLKTEGLRELLKKIPGMALDAGAAGLNVAEAGKKAASGIGKSVGTFAKKHPVVSGAIAGGLGAYAGSDSDEEKENKMLHKFLLRQLMAQNGYNE